MKSIRILDVKIDEITLNAAVVLIETWLHSTKKRYIVTPNIEFVMAAQKDSRFKKVLDEADLAIPDSSRFGWSDQMLSTNNFLKRLLIWPFFVFSKFPGVEQFPVTTGVDLTKSLISLSEEKAVRIGFLGGNTKIANRLKECLKKEHPNICLEFCSGDIIVDKDGNTLSIGTSIKKNNRKILIPNLDILFVAFGHIKQEKWIVKNLNSYPVKVMIGIGGTMDYLSGAIPRAPKWLRDLGLEWLFRVIIQPWRLARFGELIKFVFIILFKRSPN